MKVVYTKDEIVALLQENITTVLGIESQDRIARVTLSTYSKDEYATVDIVDMAPKVVPSSTPKAPPSEQEDEPINLNDIDF